MQIIILCRSVTAAQRAARLLQSEGIFAAVTKAPQRTNPGGCTYGVKVSERNLQRALAALKAGGVRIGGVFALHPDGRITEVQP